MPGGGDINSDGKSAAVSGLISYGYGSVLASVQSRGREKKGGERTLGAECVGVTVHRSAPEPRGSLAFQCRVRARRKFDRVEMAEGEELGSNGLPRDYARLRGPSRWPAEYARERLLGKPGQPPFSE